MRTARRRLVALLAVVAILLVGVAARLVAVQGSGGTATPGWG
ncbi:MAG: hypothetical protein M5U14_07370 [Acidimicrobiia bacterium]|nr:hypothetical protein [Acidimicrobiia bacterium]